MATYDVTTILPALATAAAILGIAFLAITNTLQDAISSKGQDALIIGALLSLILGSLLGVFHLETWFEAFAAIAGLAGLTLSGGSLLLFNLTRDVPRRAASTLGAPRDERERTGIPAGLEGDGDRPYDGSFPLPRGPVRREPAIGCAVQHLSGFEFFVADLTGGTWRTSYSVRIFVYVRDGGQRVDFYIMGTGNVSYGFFSRTKTVRLRQDELFGLVRCIDSCSKVLWDPMGTPTVTDGPLSAGFKIETQLVGTDTLYLYITAAASMEGGLSISSALPNTPSVTATEEDSQIALLLGANAFKCITAADGDFGNR